ncbi:hypothetical protein NDR87_31605 [Nocardia sp. CDC159]|uniref:Uncharacterized protein n=1 Tax=Nocardia pulmonis TaxID=2951408 RepID=A0A9X2EF97_9NOCA|nr:MULTISPECIES: hypothetical protein [Nocardia]MCM6777903.1 hypothetical protein [Nocardia pulmonis]MCM6790926.1 hypothetical protein [Nocardia sp. CDC159]
MKPDGQFGTPARHSTQPAQWYRTMDRGFALQHFGFPAHPRRGERHTAPDGSVWGFGLTGTGWWELLAARRRARRSAPSMANDRDRLIALLRKHLYDRGDRYETAADALLADWLIVPRSDIEGIEYGYRVTADDPTHSTWTARAESEQQALAYAEHPAITAVQRPILPWSPIPEGGDSGA